MSLKQHRRTAWVLGALFALSTLSVCAQIGGPPNNNNNSVLDPLDYQTHGKNSAALPPKPPKPFMEKDGIRYYALGQFKQDDTNTKKIWHDKDNLGKPLVLDGTSLPRGICYQQKDGVENLLMWHLDGRYAQFETTVGIPANTRGEVTFYVYGDDRRLYRTESLSAARPTEKISVPVDGVEYLSIRSHASHPASGSLMIIGDPVLTREPGM